MFSNILVYNGYVSGMGEPTGRAGTGMGKNLNPHAGMGFLACRVRVGGCGYVKPQIFIENPNPCTIAIVPGSVAIAYRTSHR
jgi:hypothetical protein